MAVEHDLPPAEAGTAGTGGRRTTAQAVVEGLVAHGVDTVFGIPGVQTYPLFDALGERSDAIRLIGARHEQTCGYMALGYAQSTGRTGVCSVVPGPGILNASAALLTALATNTPVVAVTSEVPTAYMGRGMGHVHEMPDQLATIRSFTKWAADVMEPEQAPGLLAEAFFHARSGRPGPTALAVPWDVLETSAIIEPTAPLPITGGPTLDPSALSAAVDLLAGARNPMILVGGGARDAADAVRALASQLQAPVVSLRSGRGVVPDADPLGFTCASGFERWAETDVLLAIGTRQELVWFRWPDSPAGLRTINLDIDPAQHERLQPTVALTADAREGSTALLDALRGVSEPAASRAEEFASIKSQAEAEQAGYLQPHWDYLHAIRDALPDDGFFVEEISQIGFSSLFGFPVNKPRHFITSGYQSNLGFGYPTSLGVKAAHPTTPVVSVTGDGGFLFGANELATAVQYDLGVVAVVFDNSAFGNVKADQQRIFSRDVAATLRNPDFVALARAYGADGYRADSPAELRGVLDTAFENNRPAVVHVPMPLDIATSPWRFLQPASRQGARTQP